MKLSILIPVYNEKKFIRKIINKIIKLDLGNIQKEIIVVDDGSVDSTREILNNIKKNAPKFMKIIFHKQNQGKGSAIRTAIFNSSGDYCVIQDADLEYDPRDIKLLVDKVRKKKADAVFGSRFLKKHKPKYRFLYFGNKFLVKITNFIYFSKITDMETCYKLVRTDILKKMNLKSKGFELEPEITAKLLKNKISIFEVPISYECRDYSEGKKISWKDGIKAVYYLLKYKIE